MALQVSGVRFHALAHAALERADEVDVAGAGQGPQLDAGFHNTDVEKLARQRRFWRVALPVLFIYVSLPTLYVSFFRIMTPPFS